MCRTTNQTDAQGGRHGDNHIEHGVAACKKHYDRAGKKDPENGICDPFSDSGCFLIGCIMTGINRMQQEPENHKNLKDVINKLPLPGGKISFSGVVCQSQHSKLHKYKGTEQTGQTNPVRQRTGQRAQINMSCDAL